MITFNVVKEQFGWAIRLDERMTTHFWSRELAVREANCLAADIRGHGECTEVIIQDAGPSASSEKMTKAGRSSLDKLGSMDRSAVV